MKSKSVIPTENVKLNRPNSIELFSADSLYSNDISSPYRSHHVKRAQKERDRRNTGPGFNGVVSNDLLANFEFQSHPSTNGGREIRNEINIPELLSIDGNYPRCGKVTSRRINNLKLTIQKLD